MLGTALAKGEFNTLWEFSEDEFITPPEEDEELYFEAESNKLSMIRLVTPTTDEKRLNKILLNATGFVYYVSITGVTGTHAPNIENVSINLKLAINR